jgi:3-dehydroquinate dehydratase/shikimate dehydrogenase
MLLAACIAEETTHKALEAMAGAAAWADLFELRLDYIQDPDLKRLLSSPARPLIVTNRRPDEGGRFAGGEKERLSLLRQALDYAPAMLDLELAAPDEVVQEFAARKGSAWLILSHHDFSSTPDLPALFDLLDRMQGHGADIAKIVTRADDVEALSRLKALLERAAALRQPATVFALGALGRLSRVLTPLWGSRIGYAALADGRGSAPGQFTGPEMRRVFPGHGLPTRFDSRTRLYGVLGFPVGHSLSPVIHNAAFQHLGLNAFYVPLDVESADLALEAARTFQFHGLSVTRPHKTAVLKALERMGGRIEPAALRLGAVNTLVEPAGALAGLNTDVGGLLQALEEHTAVRDRSAVVAGAGGAARAALYGLQQAGARITLTNRTEAKGREVAGAFDAAFCPWPKRASLSAEILINATPLGMAPGLDETPFPAEMLHPGMVVLDMVYSPPMTRLLREAEERGCRTVGGIAMLLYQAALQLKAWTGRPAPLGAMRRALVQALEETHEP